MNAVNKKANANGLTVGDNTYPIKKLKVCNIHGTTIDYAELPNGTKFVMNTEPFKSGYSHALSIGDVYLCFHKASGNLTYRVVGVGSRSEGIESIRSRIALFDARESRWAKDFFIIMEWDKRGSQGWQIQNSMTKQEPQQQQPQQSDKVEYVIVDGKAYPKGLA
jgi:hypothetical protein|tara:strand:+ start:161 stop:652 length:492 start_codon:yes stop_codon:yes gene_type:complete